MQLVSGPALACRALEPFAVHFFTTRRWSLGTAVPGGAACDAAWNEVAEAIGVDPVRLIRGRQVHGAGVVVAGEPSGPLSDGDIVISNTHHLAAAVQAADCTPLLVADRRTGAVAAAHAGWRGLAARVPESVVAALMHRFGSRPTDLVVAIGPSIGVCCYEVGADVRHRFEREGFAPGELARWLRPSAEPTAANPSMAAIPRPPRAGHWFFDGWAVARDQFRAAGVPDDQVFVADLCTASHPGVFCSYRRDGQGTGRLAGAIRPAPPRP